MKSKALHLSLGSLLTGFVGASVLAEQPGAMITAIATGASQQQDARPQVASVFGTQTNILQIPASSFLPFDDAQIRWLGDGYVYHTAGSGSTFAWTTLTLPSGVDLDFLDLYFCDTNAANDLTASLYGFNGWDNSNISSTFLIDVSSFGSAGCDKHLRAQHSPPGRNRSRLRPHHQQRRALPQWVSVRDLRQQPGFGLDSRLQGR